MQRQKRQQSVSQRSTSFQPRPVTLSADPHALVEIDRAVTDLRRGGFVVLRAPEAALLMLAAEAVTDAALADLTRLAGAGAGPPQNPPAAPGGGGPP